MARDAEPGYQQMPNQIANALGYADVSNTAEWCNAMEPVNIQHRQPA